LGELERQMKERGMINPFDLTEFDQWVNDATREDVNCVVNENLGRVFGLKFWSWEKIPAEKLRGTCNFGVDVIFKIENQSKVERLIEAYKKRPWNVRNARKIVDQLFNLAVMSCLWV
jgi:hypothetical protein